LRVDEVIAMKLKTVCSFLAHSVYEHPVYVNVKLVVVVVVVAARVICHLQTVTTVWMMIFVKGSMRLRRGVSLWTRTDYAACLPETLNVRIISGVTRHSYTNSHNFVPF